MANDSLHSATYKSLPRLENGDHLDQPTFHERYCAMPEDFKAELIGGVVFVSSPNKAASRRTCRDGEIHALFVAMLGGYWMSTDGVCVLGPVTVILGGDSELQPDAALVVNEECGGQTRVNEDDYLIGPPELVVEIASSSESYDLYEKRRDYERAGVQEYVVVMLRERAVRWFILEDGRYQDRDAGEDRVLRSQVFPGLWLDVDAILRRDAAKAQKTLQAGLATAEHAAFVQMLKERRERK